MNDRANNTQAVLHAENLNARELTFAEVEQVFEYLENDTDVHVIETLCREEVIPAKALALSLDLTMEQLGQLRPSQMPELFKKVRAQNSFLAQALDGIGAIAQKLAINVEDLSPSVDQRAG